MIRPTILCFSGHDPSGGAGIQADIETLFSFNVHAASVITCLTEQDTHNVRRLMAQDPLCFARQAATLLADMPIAGFKIGLIGDAAIAEQIAQVVRQYPQLPVVLDPILAAGGGQELAGQALMTVMIEQLLPQTTLLTPNTLEARRLTGLQDLNACARQLLDWGAQAVLITGTHDDSEQVHNRLYCADGRNETFHWQRLPHSYHGSGCTLAAAAAGLLARGLEVFDAVHEAQEFVWQSLQHGERLGGGQYQPQRGSWAFGDD